MESRTARLTLLIDPKKKAVFERLCAQADVTPSQLVRKFIRDYIEQQLGPDWREQVFIDGVDDDGDQPRTHHQCWRRSIGCCLTGAIP